MQRIGEDRFALERKEDHERQQQSAHGQVVEFFDKDVVEMVGAFSPDDPQTGQDARRQRDDDERHDRQQQRIPRYRHSAHTQQKRDDRRKCHKDNQVVHGDLHQRIGRIAPGEVAPYEHHRRTRRGP